MAKTLDPSTILMTFKGVNITGIMDGTFVEVERNEDGWTEHVGAAGNVTHVKNLNKTGTVTFQLSEAADTNNLLSAIAALDEANSTGKGSLLITDLNGLTRYRATEARIKKWPKGEHAKDHTGRTWVVMCAKLEIFIGGKST